MNIDQITKLEEVVPLGTDKSIVDHKIKRLAAPGENYGSLMLSVDITVKTAKGKKEINAVAKMVPPNEFIQKVFNTQSSFKSEINFYKEIVPTLRNFQIEQEMKSVIDFSPEYYGSRININGSDNVDSDAVLLLENLKLKDYANIDRMKGFDLEATKSALKELAQFHAVPLALKLKKPQLFEEKILKNLGPPHIFKPEDQLVVNKMAKTVNESDDCKIYLERMLTNLKEAKQLQQKSREPFATLVHNDFWGNNTMVKTENGKVVKSKIVDFQMCSYSSPAKDLVFFIFSSVQNDVVDKNFDTLIKHYHDAFIDVLKQLKCDTSQFSLEALMKEIDIQAKESEFRHTTFMIFPILAEKETTKEIWDLKPEDMMDDKVNEMQRNKIHFIIKQFVKHNWL